MGASTSKAAGATAKTASKLSSKSPRKYPASSPPQHTRPSITKTTAAANAPSSAPASGASSPQEDTVSNNEAPDPDLNPAYQARLQQLGIVQPNPTLSNSSTFNNPPTSTSQQGDPSLFQPSASAPSQSIFPSVASNPAVSLLTARYRLAEEAEREFEQIGRRGAQGRRFVDAFTLKQALDMRERGMTNGQIERTLELREGVIKGLGREGIVRAAS